MDNKYALVLQNQKEEEIVIGASFKSEREALDGYKTHKQTYRLFSYVWLLYPPVVEGGHSRRRLLSINLNTIKAAKEQCPHGGCDYCQLYTIEKYRPT